MAENQLTIILSAQSNQAVSGFKDVNREVNRLDSSIGKSTAGLRQQAATTGAANKAMQSFAKGGVQNLGYQVGDFAVQVGSGTNALRALSQQLPQALGSFGKYGAVAGAVVAVAGAVAMAFMNSRKKAKTLEEGMEELTSAMDAYNSSASAAETSTEDLIEKYGDLADEQQRLLDSQESLNRSAAQEALRGQINLLGELTENVGRLRDEYFAGSKQFGETGLFGGSQTRANLDRLTRRLGLTEDQLVRLFDLNNKVAEAENYEERIGSLEQIRDLFQALQAPLSARVNTENDLTRAESRRLDTYNEQLDSVNGVISAIIELNKETEEVDKAAERLKFNFFLMRDAINTSVYGADTLRDSLKATADFLNFNLNASQELQLLQAELEARQAGLGESEVQATLAGLRAEMEAISKGHTPEMIERVVEEAKSLARQSAIAKEELAELIKAAEDAGEGTKDIITLFGQEFEIAEQAAESLAKTIDTQMTDAFMSIVDGTKSTQDAFKSMAQAILKDLYNVLVVQRIVGSAANGTGLSGGIAKALGFKAMGGPVTAGRPYIVGERGPELMVPNRGGQVIPNSDLGGGVTVVQNFSIAANGDDSVKRIVMQQAPQIANMAKSAVIDARRRGGQMKAAFG